MSFSFNLLLFKTNSKQQITLSQSLKDKANRLVDTLDLLQSYV